MIFNNYAPQSVSDKGKTQAPLHSRFARVGEYPFSSSSLHFLTRILLSQNSTKLNIEWLEKHRAVCKTLTYSSYGFPATKPTNIFTNLRDISFKNMDKFGRGAKINFKLDNISVCQKQKVPCNLSDEIAKYVRGIYQEQKNNPTLPL